MYEVRPDSEPQSNNGVEKGADIGVSGEVSCAHCGDPCPDVPVVSGDLLFCCYGCKAVHELLEQAGLVDHYRTASLENPSVSLLKAERKYAFLDHEALQDQLLKFREGDLSVVKFFLPGIHCSSCIYLLEHLPRLDGAIVRSEVHFTKKEVTITFLHWEKSLKKLAILLSQLGYPPDVSPDSVDSTKGRMGKNNIGRKVAVAGFCFGNSMLMSMPEYLDTMMLLTPSFKSLFGWINLFIALPVVFYSARDYFVSAWKGLLHKRLTIDVPIVLGIVTLFGRSVFEILTHSGSGYIDSLAGLIFLLLLGKWYQGKTYQALSFERDYTSYFPVSVTCLEDREEIRKALSELKKGDMILIHNDELIPADGELISGTANIDYSFVTGESLLSVKIPGDRVYAGGRQKGGVLKVRVYKPVNNSELTQLWNRAVFKEDKGQFQNLVDRISTYFTAIVITLAVGTGVYWWLVSPSMTWNAVTAVLIVACPCALALVLPFAYGHAMRVLGRQGFYLKNAHVVEALSAIKTIIFDKTGTLTSASQERVTLHGKLTEGEFQLIKTALANSAHPLSRLVVASLPAEMEKVPLLHFNEVTGKGLEAELQGRTLRAGNAEWVGIEEAKKLNESRVYICIDGEVKGYFACKASYRSGVWDMLKQLKERFTLHLLSGDNASEYGRLDPFFHFLKFSQKPGDKLDHLEGITGKKLMIGDGLNDAGALKEADVGIAVSEDIHQFSPACDAIVRSDRVVKLPDVLRFAKKVRGVVIAAFFISFLYNVVGLAYAMTGHLSPVVSAILMPVSSISVVGFVTLMVNRFGKLLNRQEFGHRNFQSFGDLQEG